LNELSTAEEAAARLKISVRTLREWLRTGKLRGVNTGKHWRIREQDLLAFVENTYDPRKRTNPSEINCDKTSQRIDRKESMSPRKILVQQKAKAENTQQELAILL
jgi:excisionase family DNA binding protein